MSARKATIVYTYRGSIERATRRGYAWRDGFSETSAEGRPLYPWLTRAECMADAKARGARAAFVRPEVQT